MQNDDMFNSQAANLAARRLELDTQAKAIKAEMADIDGKLEGLTTFTPGKLTGHPDAGPAFKVTITQKENIKYDKDGLNTVRQVMGEEQFFKLFDWDYKPIKKEVDSFLKYADPEHKAAIEAARTMTPGKPAVKVERVEAGE